MAVRWLRRSGAEPGAGVVRGGQRPLAMLATVRIAVVGAGAMGSAAARLLARRDDVDLLILDPDGDRAEAVIAATGR
ncbi:MAG TPA: saccharopine dehydrogenase NADP-binding domain-containing protein, partial [Actinomycetota bacterium]|nr:saccharopine dehydrogenase NADP-binding domain-containing protein [Actinomycetota bacterium]